MKCTGFGAGLPDYSLFWISRYSSGHLYTPCIVVLKLSRIILKTAEAGVQITLLLHENHHKLVSWWVTFEFMCWTCLNFSGPNFFCWFAYRLHQFSKQMFWTPQFGYIFNHYHIFMYIYICIPFTMEHLGPDDLRFTLRLYNYTRFFFLKPCKSHQVHFRVRVQIPQFFFCLGRGQLYPALQKTQLVRLHLCQQAGDQLWYQRCEGAHVEACVVSWQPPPSWGFSSSTNFPPREVTPTASRTESEDDD